MKTSVSRGRRPGQPDLRERIREAARDRFLAAGYQAVTMRSIAATAGVDVALVSYYFGSKQGVFSAAMSLTVSPADVVTFALAGDLDTLAPRLLAMLLGIWDDPVSGAPLRTIITAAASEPDVNRLVSEVVASEIVARLADRLPGPAALQRAAAFCTQMAGVVFSRYLLRVEPVASMPVDDVVRHLAPSLQLSLQPTDPQRPSAGPRSTRKRPRPDLPPSRPS